MKGRRRTKRGRGTRNERRGGEARDAKISRSRKAAREAGGSIFPGLEKYLHAPLLHRISPPPLPAPPLSFFLWTGSIPSLPSIGYSVSPYSEVSQSATTFARLLFFPPPLPPSLPFPRPSPHPLPCSPRRGQRASENMNPSSRPHCLGDLYLPRAHRRNLFGPLGTRTRVRACVRACVRATVCSQVVTKIDRGGLVGMKKTGEGEGETEASLHPGGGGW